MFKCSPAIAALIAKGCHFGTNGLMFHAGAATNKVDVEQRWHRDGPPARLIMVITVKGRRTLWYHQWTDQGVVVSSIELEEGSVYITDATSFHHTVEYGATALTDPHITMVCRLAEPETSAKTKTPLLNRKPFVTPEQIQALYEYMETNRSASTTTTSQSNAGSSSQRGNSSSNDAGCGSLTVTAPRRKRARACNTTPVTNKKRQLHLTPRRN
jgi:hypothetical protein